MSTSLVSRRSSRIGAFPSVHDLINSSTVSSYFVLLLLFNTTRAHTPDPQARGPRSLWTEVWPTQPMLTHPY